MLSSLFKHIKYIVILMAIAFSSDVYAKKFIVVIDAGHGGRDPGAVGKITQEKVINLNVALRLGELIEKNCSDVKVIYTRKTDIFIPLNERANIANKAKADLFISIHTNSIGKNKKARGVSTWTLGLAKSKDNLEAAKRENSVILLEEGYEKTYAGFDPNVPETYIIFEFMQDKYMKESVDFASMVQKQMVKHTNLVNRGVHQDVFWVLKASAMPSVLIEVGFISTPEEERYLASKKGVEQLSNAIYNAFLKYKNKNMNKESRTEKKEKQEAERDSLAEIDSQSEAADTIKDEKSKVVSDAKDTEQPLTFKIQILTSSKILKAGSREFKGEKNISYYKDKGLYKYTCFESENYNTTLSELRKVSKKFKSAFIVAFEAGKRIDTNKGIKKFKEKNRKR
ncbi:MAG: N-acetylmuramoyl-L-alanine amidase [Bacteroides sp.]|nr:N-acetylmuramoyl-L-alanine amidase [Bacteroides sp.]